MSILIKDIEIPKKHITLTIFPNGYVAIYDATDSFIGETKAFPIPKHGRLIDADKIKGNIKQQTAFLKLIGGELAEIAETLEKGFLQEIDNALTIIPASKEDDK